MIKLLRERGNINQVIFCLPVNRKESSVLRFPEGNIRNQNQTCQNNDETDDLN
jgi:hypothetical protein